MKTRRRRGSTTVEMAFVLPLALLFMYAIFEYGRYLMTINVAENAAREGARMAVVQFSAGKTSTQLTAVTSSIQAATRARLAGLDNTLNATVTVVALNPSTYADAGTWDTAGPFQPIAVRITGTYKPVLANFVHMDRVPGFSAGGFPVRAQSSMGSEAN